MPREHTAPATFTEKAYTHIPMMQVESNQIACIGYNAELRTLSVQFTRGANAIYHYPNVTQETFDAFMAAESKGKFFGQHIQPLPFDKFPPLAEQEKAKAAAEQAAA